MPRWRQHRQELPRLASSSRPGAPTCETGRRGRKRALVAVGHSLLVVVWHLLNEPETPYTDLGSVYHQHLVDPTRRTRDLVRQLKALGHDVTLAPAA
ncbi:hypothetical protein HRW18_23670 [Streptomyces lunaelactis]|uniref:hypothetical protein n=1 Tax=Streptomyces lunaelactis TaxID=1535768 RepID=UPI00158575BC|nr:hypothetical protein [Streptomyces lunaelactis]NUK10929.1 hypothetical protein [Streptomyces lunaelactis]NUL23607.1 hypothetical protein [Streptomyces lunaelactis]